ncbi:MAG: hypothetical protein LUQ62_00910 [Methanomicrobiales archaeon]|nr:hypothetical protein [Methanomicrobiales archaeon]
MSGLISSWQPRKVYHSAPRYLDDLKKFVQEKMAMPPALRFSGKKTAVEFVDGGTLDFGVNRKTAAATESVGIIMKRDLMTLPDVKLLMAQIQQEEGKFGEVILLVLGEINADMESKLQHFLEGRKSKTTFTVMKK